MICYNYRHRNAYQPESIRTILRMLKLPAKVIFLILMLSSGVNAAPDISFELSPREITVGDPVEMIIRMKASAGDKVFWPQQDEMAPAEILSVDTLDNGREEFAIRYQISVYEPGETDLPDIPVLIQNGNVTDTLYVDPGSISVTSVISANDSLANIRDIKPPVSLRWTLSDILPYLITVLIVLIVGAAAFFLYRRWQRKLGVLPEYVPPSPPPYATALRNLEELRIKKLWENGLILEYYSELTTIIKHYIEGRYGLDAPEMTTYELMNAREKWSQDEQTLKPVERILNCADMVKFAKYKPGREDHTMCMDAGFEYVSRTKPEVDVAFEEKSELTPESDAARLKVVGEVENASVQ